MRANMAAASRNYKVFQYCTGQAWRGRRTHGRTVRPGLARNGATADAH